MSRTNVAKTALLGAYAGDGLSVVEVPADSVNLNAFPLNGGEILIARNVHPTDAFTVTVTSVANARGRTKNITADSILANESHVYGPFQPAGWKQASDGMLYFQASAGAAITFTVTIASPAVVSKTGHGFVGNERIVLKTTGALPTGLAPLTVYYVQVIDVDTFNLALTPSGTPIVTTGSQSGTHTYSVASILFTVLKP
jgi:hypothetical protein